MSKAVLDTPIGTTAQPVATVMEAMLADLANRERALIATKDVWHGGFWMSVPTTSDQGISLQADNGGIEERVHDSGYDPDLQAALNSMAVKGQTGRFSVDIRNADARVIHVDARVERSGGVTRLALVGMTSDTVEPATLDAVGEQHLADWVQSVDAAAAVVARTPKAEWNTTKLRHPEDYYITEAPTRAGGTELRLDVAKVRADWPQNGFGDDNQYRALRITVGSDGTITTKGDPSVPRAHWNRMGGTYLYEHLRAAMVHRAIAIAPADVVAATEKLDPNLRTYSVMQSSPEFRTLATSIPLVAIKLNSDARHGNLVRGTRKDVRAKRSFNRIPEMAQHPLAELVTAATIERPEWKDLGPEEFTPASPALVEYVRHPIAELASGNDLQRPENLLDRSVVTFLSTRGDAAQVSALHDPKMWGLVRYAIGGYNWSVLGEKLLEDPQAARSAIDSYGSTALLDIYDRENNAGEDVIHDVAQYMTRTKSARSLTERAEEHPELLPSFVDLATRSQKWHQQLRRREAPALDREINEEKAFAPSGADGVRVGDLRLVQLRTHEELWDNDHRMGVSMYHGWDSENGRAIVFAVERPAGKGWEQVATLELDDRYTVRHVTAPAGLEVKPAIRAALQKAVRAHAPNPHSIV